MEAPILALADAPLHSGQDALGEALEECYERWKEDQRPQPPALAAMLHRLSAHAHARLTKYELALCHKCKQHCDRSRRFAENDQESEACHAMAVAQTVARSPALSEEASLLCWAEIEPAEAHIERLAANWSGAHSHYARSCALDETLETNFGYHEKIAHRVHMLTVGMTLLAGQGRYTEAASKAAIYLQYLSGKTVKIDEPGEWSSTRLQSLPKGMKSVLATHILTSLISTLVCLPSSERNGTIEAFARTLEISSQATSLQSMTTAETTHLAQWLIRSAQLSQSQQPGQSQQVGQSQQPDPIFTMLLEQMELSRGTPLFHLLAFDAACLLSDEVLVAKISLQVAAKPWWLSLRGRWRKRLMTSSRRESRFQSTMQICNPA